MPQFRTSFPFILPAGPQNQSLAKTELDFMQELFKQTYIVCQANTGDKRHGWIMGEARRPGKCSSGSGRKENDFRYTNQTRDENSNLNEIGSENNKRGRNNAWACTFLLKLQLKRGITKHNTDV